MLDPGEARLVTRVIMPGSLGRHAVATIYVEYANEGTASMPAPLLVLKSADPDGSDRPILTLDETRIVQNYWSAGLPPGTANEVFILASGAQSGMLNAGERRLVPVYYLGLQQPWNFSDNNVEMEIRYWTADDASPIDWAARKETLRPPTLDPATWDVVYANLTAELATTGDYVRMLSDNAQFLGRLGLAVTDVDDLWNAEVQQAYGFSAIPVLDSAVDSAVTAPGVTLDLARRFASNVRARNSTGWFGRGWYTPWQARLVVEDGGNLLKLVGEAGSARIFSRDTRNYGYFAGVGDSSTLAPVGGGLYELRDPNGIVTRFRADGRIDYVQDPNGNRVTAAWDGAGRLQTLSHTSGDWISLAYNGAGHVESVANSAGRSATYAYSGSYLQSATTDDGKVTAYTYETAGTLAQHHALLSVTRGGATRTFTFDPRGRVASTFLASGEQLVQFGYDSAGGVSITDAQGTTRLSFDHRGLLAKVVDPLGNVTTAEFNNDLRLSRLIAPTGESQSFDWCNCGSLTRFTDELGHTTRFNYDNPFRRLTSFTDARGHTTAYTYDTRGNLLATIYPNNSVERFGGYTASGLPQSYTNRRGQPISYTYTPAGQVDRQTFADGSFNDFDYDHRGNLTNVLEHPAAGPDKVTSYAYDYAASGDRLRKVTYPTARWVEFFYDAFGRRERMTDSTGQDLRYDYDAAGRLWHLRDATNAVLVEYLYSAAGRLQRVNKGNGTYTTYDYDAAGQLLHLVNHAPNGAVNSRFDYTYDRRGRRVAMGTVDGNWTYDYDATGQLIRARLASTNPQIPNQDLQYNYDPLGNRTYTVTNGVRVDYAANNLNQYTTVGGVAFQYDADGNLAFDGVRNYQYDAQNRLVRVTGPEGVTEYEYDALGNRTSTVLNGQRTEYLLDPSALGDVVAEHDGTGVLVANLVHGLGLIGRSYGNGPIRYFDYDAQGSTAGITANAGHYINRYAYAPFGGELLDVASVPNPFRQVGQLGVVTGTSGELFARTRSYSTVLGRFLAPDPAGLDGGDANLYRLVENSPLDYVDPDGLRGKVIYRPNLHLPAPDGRKVNGYYDPSTGNIYVDSDLPYKECVLAHERAHKRNHEKKGGSSLSCNQDEIAASEAGYKCAVRKGYKDYAKQQSTKISKIKGGYDYCKPPSPPPPAKPPGGGGPGGPGGSGGSGASSSVDPNEKFGPKGVGVKNWVRNDAVLPDRINFENLGPGSVDGSGNPYTTFASAPAQRVTISDPLSAHLDWSTFQLVELGFGDTMVPIPAGRAHYAGSVPMTFNGRAFNVELEAGIDLASGRVFAVFQSIDPQTSLPPDVLTGFLPPEDGTGRGMGHFSFLIKARTNLVTGTDIRNAALIEFDRQMTIATDQIDPHNPAAGVDPTKQALVTIDSGSPGSSVTALPIESGRAFVVQWSGADDALGSGIASYDVFVSTNGAMFVPWFSNVTERSSIFIGDVGSTYAFYCTARDNVGNIELPPVAPDAITLVSTNSPLLAAVTNLDLSVGSPFSFSNGLAQAVPGHSYTFSLDPYSVARGAKINRTNGTLSWTPKCQQARTTNSVTVWVTDNTWTNLSDAITFTTTVGECLEPTLGTLILPVGQRGRLPVNLLTSEQLTNLTMTLDMPVERLIDPSVEIFEEAADFVGAAEVTPTTNLLYLINLAASSNAWMFGTQQVAWLYVTAATNQRSAFVQVNIGDFIGARLDGLLVTNVNTQSGRVVVLAEEPLLEALRGTNRQPAMVLYATEGTNRVIEATANFGNPASWATWWQGPVSNVLFRAFENVADTNRALFFRAISGP
jgi:RHS repeat-associated protein